MTPSPAPEQESPDLNVDQLIELLGDDLDTLAREAIDGEYANERRIAINRAKRNWKFVKGDHFFAPGWVDDGDREYVDYVSVDGSPEDNGAAQKFCYPVNVIGADCWKFVAVMGQNAPNVKCVADDLDEQASIDAARKADISVVDFKAKWKSDAKQRDLAFHQFTTGPVFGYTNYVTDGRKYGTTKVPKMELVPQQQPDGSTIILPQQVGEQEYENGDVELNLANILQVAIPFGKKELKQCEWLRYEYLESKYTLLKLYRKRLKAHRNDEDGTRGSTRDSATNTAIQAQESTAVPSGLSKTWKRSHWLYSQTWFEPQMFEGIQDERKRQIAQKHWPDGLHAIKVNDTWVDLENESKNDCWGVCKTGRGEYIMENALCHDSIPFQRATNDVYGLGVETVLRSIAKTVVDQGLIDRKSASENEATPAEIIFTMGSNVGDISKSIAALPMARFSDQLIPFLNLIRATMQDVNGMRPELFGGGEVANTYREAKQRKDQAMMTLAPVAAEHGEFWETVNENGTRLRAKYGSGVIKVRRDAGFGASSESVDQSDLTEGNWHCEADDGVPLSFTERADKLLGLLKEYPPEVLAALSLTDIVNIGQNLQLLQLTGYQSPMEDAYRKTIKIIGLLSQEEPIPGQPGPPDSMTGQPGPPGPDQPSIPLDDIEDDPAFTLQVCQKWMNSKEGQKLRDGNARFFANVKAYAAQAKQKSQPAPAPPPPPHMSVTMDLTKADPGTAATILKDYNLIPANAPPPQMAQPPAPKVPSSPPAEGEPQAEPLPPQPIDSGIGAPQPVIQ